VHPSLINWIECFYSASQCSHCKRCTSVIFRKGLVFVVVVCGVVCWASAAGVDIVAMLTVCALCVCVSIATRVYGLIVTGCSVGGVSLITEVVVWLSCSTSNIRESWVRHFPRGWTSQLPLLPIYLQPYTPINGRYISTRHGCHLWRTGRDCSGSVPKLVPRLVWVCRLYRFFIHLSN